MSSLAKHVAATAVVLVVGTAAAGAVFVWSGAYDVGADAKHTPLVHSMLDTLRERSVKVRADALQVPDLTDESRIRQGAGNYDAMCVQCHLAPGVEHTELSRGLYPEPPDLTKHKTDPAHAFWIVKHGIKASAMPAWGHSMPDADIWNVAAFLQQLPELDPQRYAQMVAASDGHSHGGEAAGHHDAGTPMNDHHKANEDATPAKHATGTEGHHADESDTSDVSPPAASLPEAVRSMPRAAAGHYDDGHKH